MISGVWLPIVTPFVDGAVDFAGYERLLEHYLGKGVSGVFPLGTTGESPTIDDDEMEALVERTVGVVAGRVPVFVGVGGNATRKVLATLKRLERHRFEGIVSVCPYYNRPSQDGMREHFTRIAEATDRQILVYNIPYRTSVNLANDTLLRLAELPNVVGVKDSSGNLAQSLDLLRQRPEGFAVMTGDDALFYTMLAHGGDGGILASCHVATEGFVGVHARMAANDHHAARAIWSRLEAVVPLLFKEANPMPIKHCVWRQGLITSPECRLPLTRISSGLADELDRALKNAVV
ncbi:MAG: 4-hydroxy-tetrahydrodipicolinate synthase [Candidatus Rokuibacteriota bacterium]|nr:MAG: 4-hydroxy-tetrahydrodipicolinate synthase [Candidatus Rokubacteria bacterium]PYN20319.1 MAG: 4-hydroxy-tetrahydrodipicolinate synthase [Candidatus Rokubacteria bacterium]